MANIEAFLGKWRLVSSEGFEDYMKELGKRERNWECCKKKRMQGNYEKTRKINSPLQILDSPRANYLKKDVGGMAEK